MNLVINPLLIETSRNFQTTEFKYICEWLLLKDALAKVHRKLPLERLLKDCLWNDAESLGKYLRKSLSWINFQVIHILSLCLRLLNFFKNLFFTVHLCRMEFGETLIDKAIVIHNLFFVFIKLIGKDLCLLIKLNTVGLQLCLNKSPAQVYSCEFRKYIRTFF